MYYLPRLIEEETYYTSNLNLLWVSAHHISPSTKEVEYEYIERIVHLRRQDMTDNAISLVTIDIVRTTLQVNLYDTIK